MTQNLVAALGGIIWNTVVKDDADYDELLAMLHHKYGLADPQQAVELCESRLVAYGQSSG